MVNIKYFIVSGMANDFFNWIREVMTVSFIMTALIHLVFNIEINASGGEWFLWIYVAVFVLENLTPNPLSEWKYKKMKTGGFD